MRSSDESMFKDYFIKAVNLVIISLIVLVFYMVLDKNIAIPSLGIGCGILGLVSSKIFSKRMSTVNLRRIAAYSIFFLSLSLVLLMLGEKLGNLVTEKYIDFQRLVITEEDDRMVDELLNNSLTASAGIIIGLLGLFLIGVANITIPFLGISIRPFNELSGNAKFLFGLLFALFVIYGFFILIFSPSHLLKNIVEVRRSWIPNDQLITESDLIEIPPSRYNKKTYCQRTLYIVLQNVSPKLIATESILVSFPERFFDGYFVDYERDTDIPTPVNGTTLFGFLKINSNPTMTFPQATIGANQTYTITIPIKTNSTGDFSGQIDISTWMANESFFRGRFSEKTNRVIAQISASDIVPCTQGP